MQLDKKSQTDKTVLKDSLVDEKQIKNWLVANREPREFQPELIKDTPKKKNKFSLFRVMILFLIVNVGIEGVKLFFGNISCGAHKAYNAEAKQYVSSMNKGQQAFFAENGQFANSVDKLGLGIKTKTRNFQYSTQATTKAAFNYGIIRPDAEDAYKTVSFGLFWWNERREFKSYVGAVFLESGSKSAPDNLNTVSIICQSIATNQPNIAQPKLQNGIPVCGDRTQELARY